MTEKHLILHIGLGKCGTSSLQAFLAINAQKLQSLNFCYPELESLDGGRSGQITSGNGALLARSLLDQGHFFQTGAKAARMELLEAKVRFESQGSVILSSEFFSMLDENQAGQFIETLNSWGFQITVVCYVRRQDHMAVSNYVQGLIAGHSSVEKDFEEEVVAVSQRFCYSRLLKPWILLGENNRLRLRVFESNRLVGGDVISDFLSVLGLDSGQHEFARTKALNESLNAPSAYLLYLIRKHYPQEQLNPQFVDVLKSLEWGDARRNDCLLGLAARRQIETFFDEDNNNVARELLGGEYGRLFESVTVTTDDAHGPCKQEIVDLLPLVRHFMRKGGK